MKRYILFIFLLLLAPLAMAQKRPVLGDPSASQFGSDIQVDYSIQMEADMVCIVAVYISCDGGRHFQKTPLRQVEGDVGIVRGTGNKTLIWHVLKEESALTGEDLVFKVNVERFWKEDGRTAPPHPLTKEPKIKKEKKPVKKAIVAAPSVGFIPGLSYGLMAGWPGTQVGFYGKFRSNFVSTGASYECTRDGKAGSDYIWTTGKSQVSNLAVTAGIMLPVSSFFYPYAGVGFVKRDLAWEDSQGKWARVKDASVSGIGLEAGVILRLGIYGFHAGINTGNFKYIGADAGIALFF